MRTRLLTTRDVAAMHGYSPSRARRLAINRDLGKLVGRDRLFTPSEARRMKPGKPGNPDFGPGFHKRRKEKARCSSLATSKVKAR